MSPNKNPMHEVPVHNDRDFAFPTSQFSHRFTILIYAAPFAHMRPFLYGQNFYISNIISYYPPSIRAPRPLERFNFEMICIHKK